MALSASRQAQAESEARAFLEYSIYVLCLLLGVDPASVDHPYTIPVAEGHPQYDQYLSLQKQLEALSAIPAAS
jgi:hypothetical protein